MRFEWDDDKREAVIAKHGIDFYDVVPLFEISTALIVDQPVENELRVKRIILGPEQVFLAIVYTYRDSGNTIRLITAHRASAKDRKAYIKKFDRLRQ